MIEVNHLSKRYRLGQLGATSLREELTAWWQKRRNPAAPENSKRDFWALQDVSFQVTKGEVLGIIGRNGAGKSTLLKILSRITEPTEGKVILHGRVGSLLEVGTGFHPELSGRENIYLNGAILGMKRWEVSRKFDEIVAFAGVEAFLDTPVKRYSSGMYVRLAFAVAAHLEPEILIMDEVLAVGDADFQEKCIGKLSDVARHGRTILFVSHNMATVSALCNRAILLQNGRCTAEGAVADVVDAYLGQNQAEATEDHSVLHMSRTRGDRKLIHKVWFENDTGEIQDMLRMGDSCRFCMEIVSPDPVLNPGVYFIIENDKGFRIFAVSNYELQQERISLEGTVQARLHLPALQLMPGIYQLSVLIMENQYRTLDFVEHCRRFRVLEKDIYGTGKLNSVKDTVCYSHGKIVVKPVQ